MKKGAPISAVIAPTGISIGAKAVLATVSATTRRVAPVSAAAGMRRACRGPTSLRAR
jgi:hypothetical protein